MNQEHTLLTPLGPITIVRAQPSELNVVLDILEEAAYWLTSKGIDQWRPGSFLGPRGGTIIDQISRGEVYLAKRDGMAVGTLTLQWEDKMFWRDVPDDAGYVHRIAIRRAFGGTGLGRQLLKWAEDMVVAAGKDYLRLDCMPENEALRKYYEQASFVYHGEIQGEGWRASLYEKRVPAE